MIVFGYAQVGMSYQYYYAQLRSQATPSPASTADVISLGLWLYRLNTVSTATSVALNIIVTCLIGELGPSYTAFCVEALFSIPYMAGYFQIC